MLANVEMNCRAGPVGGEAAILSEIGIVERENRLFAELQFDIAGLIERMAQPKARTKPETDVVGASHPEHLFQLQPGLDIGEQREGQALGKPVLELVSRIVHLGRHMGVGQRQSDTVIETMRISDTNEPLAQIGRIRSRAQDQVRRRTIIGVDFYVAGQSKPLLARRFCHGLLGENQQSQCGEQFEKTHRFDLAKAAVIANPGTEYRSLQTLQR